MLPLIAGIAGPALSEQERRLFTRLQPAGYILFTRNITDYELCRELTDELRRLTRGEDEPIIAIDQEGGRVVRTADIGVHLPSAAALAEKGSQHLIRQAALYNAAGLHTLGVNTVFGPVLDMASRHANALPGRCWGRDAEQVISNAGVWNRQMRQRDIATCGKHFPGMGEAESDPHLDLPVLHGTTDDFLTGAAIPFNALAPELSSVMIAHLLIPEIDAELPTSLSPALIRDFLRRQLGYEGVVFTDDLCMGAIAKRYTPEQSVPLALKAGCDLPLVCHDVCEHLEGIAAAIAREVPQQILREAEERIAQFRFYCHTERAMSFLEWNDYLKNTAEFCSRVPEPAAVLPASAVQTY